MAVFIEEFSQWVIDPGGGPLRAPMQPAITNQSVAVGSSSVQSAAFNNATRFIRVTMDSGAARILFGGSPTVTNSTGTRFTSSMSPEYFGVPYQASAMLAVITGS